MNAAAPIVKAHRDEQGLAVGVVFLFSLFALLTFQPIATAAGLDPKLAGVWSGLAVNDLSSAVAVGALMGGNGAVMATAAKSVRILSLTLVLMALSLMRREGQPIDVSKSVAGTLPRFLFGYVGLAIARTVGDRVFGSSTVWASVLAADEFLIDLTMLTVSAGIGLHMGLRSLLASSGHAVLVGGAASLWMASLTLALVVAVAREMPAVAVLVAVVGLGVSYVSYKRATRADVQAAILWDRFRSGAPLSLAEATKLLDVAEFEETLDEPVLRRLLVQLHPAIGELIPVRRSPLPHGEGCRWITCWQGRSGWALVAVYRDRGSMTPIHAHPHRLLGKAIEGMLEELRFREVRRGELELASRSVLGHEELVETEALDTLHVVRAVGQRPAIDLQFRGPETGRPGRSFRVLDAFDPMMLPIGGRLRVVEHIDDRPGQGGEGAAAGSTSRTLESHSTMA